MQASPATTKGAATRDSIIDRAYQIVRKEGFEGLSIGSIADSVGMSKSGVFAHFGSREDLQLSVLDAAAQRFTEHVFLPALRERRGLPRLEAIGRRWMKWLRNEQGGCPMISAAIEYDDRPGAIRDRVIFYQTRLRKELARAIDMAIETGELRTDTDSDQLAFEIFGVELAMHHDSRLFGFDEAIERSERALDRLVASYRS
ncbi:MAG TPA: TetR/AcrR family transcriptional regulator [Rhodanobacteraceae bacterium]|jgi:AcrR family transcriptional regulator|nr:TetR/AcrR family transcriptional regulator [Rhodanobacteraceae bacterium]